MASVTTQDSGMEDYKSTDIDEIGNIVNELRDNFYETTPTDYNYRINQLESLLKAVEENEDEMCDLYKEYFGGFSRKHIIVRLGLLKRDIIIMCNNLKSLMNNTTHYKQQFPISIMWSAQSKPYPKGVVSIIAPWNYPIQLLLRPLIGAIAAGNAVVLKPSEITPKISDLMLRLVNKYLDTKMIRCILGGIPETTKLLEQKFDLICFTGSTFVGKIVMKAASKHLTPVLLELGGKNPVIIDDKANLENSAKRLVYGRWWFNAGQVCVCPEYILISESRYNELIKYFRKYMKSFFSDKQDWAASEHFGKVVNRAHWRRLNKIRQHYITKESDKIVIGNTKEDIQLFGEANEDIRHMPPLVLSLTEKEFYTSEIMKNEVFGPFLTIIKLNDNNGRITSDNLVWKKKVLSMIRSKGEPLVCYIYSPNKSFINYFNERVSAGSITCNDCIYHMSLNEVPFGGVGESGMGHYGGLNSFHSFSNQRPLNYRSHGLEFLNNDRYPPNDLKKIEGLLKKITPTRKSGMTNAVKYSIFITLVGVALYYAAVQKGIL